VINARRRYLMAQLFATAKNVQTTKISAGNAYIEDKSFYLTKSIKKCKLYTVNYSSRITKRKETLNFTSSPYKALSKKELATNRTLEELVLDTSKRSSTSPDSSTSMKERTPMTTSTR
jgi:hypothetical protein